jgi:hypothetical protein
LLQKRGSLLYFWSSLSSELIEPEELANARRELLATLREPLLPPPRLRREAFFFPSIVQDLIGNAFVQEQFAGIGFGAVFERLATATEELGAQVGDSEMIGELGHYRWMLRKKRRESIDGIRNSISSQSTGVEGEKTQCVLVGLMKAIKKTVKVHCLAVAAGLQELSEGLSFVTGYCMMVRNT